MTKPRFISLEGSEACGKSTQIALLREALEKRGDEVIVTREPGGTPLGESIRHLLKHAKEGQGMTPEAEILLFTASRAQLARSLVAPSLAAGKWVLSDRFGDSTTVYQGVARQLPMDQVTAINRFAMGGIIPSLTIVLDLSHDEAFARLKCRPVPTGQRDRMEEEPSEFYERVREGYHRLAGSEPDRVKILPAAADVETVQKNLWKLVSDAFSL